MITGVITNENLGKIKILSSFANFIKIKTNYPTQLLIFSNSDNLQNLIEQNKSSFRSWQKIINFKIKPDLIYLPEVITQILLKEKFTENSSYIIAPSDSIFQEVIPFLSTAQNGSLISQVENIKEIDNELCYITLAFGGKTQLYIKPLKTPVFITLKNFNYDSLKDEQNSIKIENREILEIKTNIEILKYVQQEKHLKLEEAKIIVSGGRGLGNKEGFELIKELADLLGGAIGASRAAVDSGWIDPYYQIGQTGKTVSPDLYIAVGISGASQHIMGMNKSKFIVSINTDPEAPIFKYSHLGIIEDYKEFLPTFIRILKENKS